MFLLAFLNPINSGWKWKPIIENVLTETPENKV